MPYLTACIINNLNLSVFHLCSTIVALSVCHSVYLVPCKACTVLVFADDLPRRRPPQIYKPPTAEMIAYLDFSVSTTGMLTGVKVKCATSFSPSQGRVGSSQFRILYKSCFSKDVKSDVWQQCFYLPACFKYSMFS